MNAFSRSTRTASPILLAIAFVGCEREAPRDVHALPIPGTSPSAAVSVPGKDAAVPESARSLAETLWRELLPGTEEGTRRACDILATADPGALRGVRYESPLDIDLSLLDTNAPEKAVREHALRAGRIWLGDYSFALSADVMRNWKEYFSAAPRGEFTTRQRDILLALDALLAGIMESDPEMKSDMQYSFAIAFRMFVNEELARLDPESEAAEARKRIGRLRTIGAEGQWEFGHRLPREQLP